MRTSIVAVAFVILACLAIAPQGRAASVARTISATNFQWSPTSVSVNVGDSVTLTLTNNDGVRHTFELPAFGISQDLPAASSATVTFTASQAGSFPFHCAIHASMTGTFVVSAPSTPPPTPGFEALAAIGAIGATFVVVAVWRRRPA